jgi:ATP-dependent RNA helicase RhlE
MIKDRFVTTFETLGLSAQLLRAVESEGFTAPTPIQSQAIPHMMNGFDLMGVAQTGGGKTAAFVLPILHKLIEEDRKPDTGAPRCLILAPTRELAQQIGEAIRTFLKGQRIFYTVIYGGSPYRQQLAQLQRGVHIVVATPGRLMDHIERGSLKLDQVNTLVLDEADRMLDMGFVNEVKKLASQLPADKQTVMFSATMSKGVRTLAQGLLDKPKQVESSRENTVATTINHSVLCIKHKDKYKMLDHVFANSDLSKVLIFTRTKSMADRLTESLQKQGRKVDAIHGDRQQSVRQRVLKSFRNGHIDVLVATDVAARGIDVPDISHVINFDMPLEGDSYVHRIGRTGRAGASGHALSFCTTEESDLLQVVEGTIKMRINVDRDHPYHAELDPVKTKNEGVKRRFGGSAGRGNGGGAGAGNSSGRGGPAKPRLFKNVDGESRNKPQEGFRKKTAGFKKPAGKKAMPLKSNNPDRKRHAA